MTAAEIGSLISQYGFPIVMCAALFWYLTKQIKQVTEAYNELRIAIINLTTTLGGD